MSGCGSAAWADASGGGMPGQAATISQTVKHAPAPFQFLGQLHQPPVAKAATSAFSRLQCL